MSPYIWDKPGVPHKHWEITHVYDMEEPTHKCEMCGFPCCRYVYTLRHRIMQDLCVDVGSTCAPKLIEEYSQETIQGWFSSINNYCYSFKKTDDLSYAHKELASSLHEVVKLDDGYYAVFSGWSRRKVLGRFPTMHTAQRMLMKYYIMTCSTKLDPLILHVLFGNQQRFDCSVAAHNAHLTKGETFAESQNAASVMIAALKRRAQKKPTMEDARKLLKLK